MLRMDLQIVGDELPRKANRIALEIVAKRKISEHLEEGVVPGGVPHLLEVVVLAAGPHAFLRSRRAPLATRRLVDAEKNLLERHHPGVRKEQRRVIAGHE